MPYHCEIVDSCSEHSLHSLSAPSIGSTTTLTDEGIPTLPRESNPFMRTIYPDYSDRVIPLELFPPLQPMSRLLPAAAEPDDRVAAFRDAGAVEVGIEEYGGYVLRGRLRFRNFVVTCPPIDRIRIGDTLSLKNSHGDPVTFAIVTHVRSFEKNWVVFSLERAADPPGVVSPWIPSTHMGDLAVPIKHCRLPILTSLSRFISFRRMPNTLDTLLTKLVKSHKHTGACPLTVHAGSAI